MANVPEIYATVKVNNEKLTEFLKEFIPDYKAGKITYEEIHQKIVENILEICDVKIGR